MPWRVMELVCAAIFTVAVALPIVTQLQAPIVDSDSLTKLLAYCSALLRRRPPGGNAANPPELLRYYPADSATSFIGDSDSRVTLSQLRPVRSSPALSGSASSSPRDKTRALLLPAASSSYVATERTRLPILDIGWDYDFHRFKAVEASLCEQYGEGNHPPGDVLLNCMHLNLLDSLTNVRQSRGGLFDFLKSELALNLPGGAAQRQRLNPLDHFVPRSRERRTHRDKSVETVQGSGRCDESSGGNDSLPETGTLSADRDRRAANNEAVIHGQHCLAKPGLATGKGRSGHQEKIRKRRGVC